MDPHLIEKPDIFPQEEHDGEVFWLTSAGGVVVYVSPSYEKVWQRSCESLYENPTSWINAIHIDDRTRVHEAFFTKVFKGGFYEEYRIIRGDGSIRWIRDRGFPIRNKQGDITQVGGIAEDITESIQTDLSRSNEELVKFAYIASHDLQEPLRTISSHLEIFLELQDGKICTKAQEHVDFILDASRRMRELISGLLNHSKAGITHNLETIDIEELLSEVLDLMGYKIIKSKANIFYDKKQDKIKVLYDRQQLARVFLNLLSNAIKFSRKDVCPKIVISVVPENGNFRFTIKDNGKGIKKEEFNKIFNMFFKGSITSKISGSGIGLAVCEKIIRSHGGIIWVESIVGEGSTFFFTIPKHHTKHHTKRHTNMNTMSGVYESMN